MYIGVSVISTTCCKEEWFSEVDQYALPTLCHHPAKFHNAIFP